jgi:DNA-binding transcriptional ArsR family regulator
LKAADKIFYSLSDPQRRMILQMLSENEMTVNSISAKFRISRPAISKHLRILQSSKLVKPRKTGRYRYYRLNPDPLNEVHKWLKYFDKFWDEKLNSLKNFMENKK